MYFSILLTRKSYFIFLQTYNKIKLYVAVMFWVRIFIYSLINAECSYRLSSYLFLIPQYYQLRARVCWWHVIRASAIRKRMCDIVHLSLECQGGCHHNYHDIIWCLTEISLCFRRAQRNLNLLYTHNIDFISHFWYNQKLLFQNIIRLYLSIK